MIGGTAVPVLYTLIATNEHLRCVGQCYLMSDPYLTVNVLRPVSLLEHGKPPTLRHPMQTGGSQGHEQQRRNQTPSCR